MQSMHRNSSGRNLPPKKDISPFIKALQKPPAGPKIKRKKVLSQKHS